MADDDKDKPSEVKPPCSYVFRERPPDWFKVWVLAKPELIPAHLAWIFTLVLAVFATAAWRDAKDTTGALAGQAKAAQGQLAILQAEQRPWLYATAVPTEGLRFDSPQRGTAMDRPQAFVSLKLPIGNAGRMPARFVHLEGNLLYRASSITQEAERQRGTLDVASRNCKSERTSTQVARGVTVFPGQIAIINDGFEMFPDEIDRWRANFNGPFRDLIVTGCIDYIIGDKTTEHHQTGFAFKVVQTDGAQISPPSNQLPSAKIELHNLRLEAVGDAMLDAD